MVARDGAAPISQVWLLADDATFAAVPPLIVAEAVKLVLTGKGIVILGQRLEPAVDVRDGLLDVLDLMGKTADMTSFPGGIYDADGKSLDLTMPDLLQEQIDGCPHRFLVSDRKSAPVARVWMLANDATPDAIHPVIMSDAVELVLAGKSVLILAQRPEPGVDVRTALLQALDLFTATQDVAGRA